MRDTLSKLIADAAGHDPETIVLSGDHGYALFDLIRKRHPAQFLNVGVMEQAMVGIAAGLCKTGYRPIVYGLAAFVPIRVLEQIKLDVCYPGLPVTFIGDGAGVVYSTLGTSHQCGEDVAALRAVPNIRIYSPCDAHELRACFRELRGQAGPGYLRIGKADRPPVHETEPASGTEPHFVQGGDGAGAACLVATGSMVHPASVIARELRLPLLSVPRLRPLTLENLALLAPFREVIVLEEHSRHGGLASTLAEILCERPPGMAPRIRALALQEKFAERCGSYQYALSEHGLADPQLRERVIALVQS